MFSLIKRVSHFERQADASMERFLFHHQFLGFFIVFIGMPLVTLAAVCAGTAMIAFPLAVLFDWI